MHEHSGITRAEMPEVGAVVVYNGSQEDHRGQVFIIEAAPCCAMCANRDDRALEGTRIVLARTSAIGTVRMRHVRLRSVIIDPLR
ncbi:hypothetical protein [Amycolatopsis sp. CA-230715]|uniref:hypothetical protein n=1 Tax=Amycolatopsis sp. CA-230715 TaxID=2745196 RepID=UPI001C0363C3|nr:hypothetical protein [Amycolatopsis sp. CA-230715]QWF82577.1 hypothetical protein HUW46_06015 [Amycolatopsis sp. CA-230715]